MKNRRSCLPDHFIPVPECESILSKPLRIMTCVDGSALAQTALEYTLKCLVMQDKRHIVEVVHISDKTMTDLPPKYRPDAIKADVEARLAFSVSKNRGSFELLNLRPDISIGELLLEESDRFNADFIVMGFLGNRKATNESIEQMKKGPGLGRPRSGGRPSSAAGLSGLSRGNSPSGGKCAGNSSGALVHREPKRELRRMYTIHPISSNNMILLGQAKAAIIIMQNDHTDAPGVLPIGRPARFVISVSLNAAATQALLDSLRLSKPGDFLDVVYVKSFMEGTESDYTKALREKYNSFFDGLQGSTNSEQFRRFQDRICTFRLLEKRRGKTTAQAVADYANQMNADFVCVGTNVMRQERGKLVLGSVSAEVILETTSNIVVSHYIPENLDRGHSQHAPIDNLSLIRDRPLPSAFDSKPVPSCFGPMGSVKGSGPRPATRA